ncbi:hypothetical protein ACFFF7_05935 [Novosphingobium aquiterrae]|uniref:Uncharacterized protein n=1 Tax=Novosphingobium aquiterrae TaxID=624388 RepID=A0ABV6PGJ0_9SPHN
MKSPISTERKKVEAVPEWTQQLCKLALQCGNASPAGDPVLLGEAYRILSEAPSSFAGLIAELPDRHTIGGLIAVGAYESAALRLLPTQFGMMLSRGPGRDNWLASCCLGGRETDVTCIAGSASAALLGAYLQDLAGFFGADTGHSIPN